MNEQRRPIQADRSIVSQTDLHGDPTTVGRPEEVSSTEIDVLMERLRAEVTARMSPVPGPVSIQQSGVANDEMTAARVLSVRQLLALPDSEFADAACRAVLGPHADREGKLTIQRRLDLGQASRLDILVELRALSKGREKRGYVPGLAWRAALHRARNPGIIDTARAAVRVMRNVTRLALYMRTVVARVDRAELRAANAETVAAKVTLELAGSECRIKVLAGQAANLTDRVAQLEQAMRNHTLHASGGEERIKPARASAVDA
jgi:hypothetical protein